MPEQPARRDVLELLARSQPAHAPAAPTCHGCGYSLDGLEPGATCPECGAVSSEFGAVAPLHEADARFRSRVALGALVAGYAALSLCAWTLGAGVVVVVDRDSPSAWIGFAQLLALVHVGLAAAGLRLLATREVRGGARVQATLPGLIVRLASETALLLCVGLAAALALGVATRWHGGLIVLAGALAAAAGGAALPLAAALTARIGQWRLKQWFEDLQVAVPLVGIVGVCVLVGPVLSVALWGVAMVRLARAVRGATGGGGPVGRGAT